MSCALRSLLAPSVDYFSLAPPRGRQLPGVVGGKGNFLTRHTKEMSQSILIYWNNFRSVSVTHFPPKAWNESLDLQKLCINKQMERNKKTRKSWQTRHAGVRSPKPSKLENLYILET